MLPRIPFIDFDDDGPSDTWSKWGMGVAVPAAIGCYGISRMLSREVMLYERRGVRMPLSGWDAVAFGIVILSVALFMHARYFMAHSKSMSDYAELGKIVALLAGIGSVGFIVVRNFTLI
ncbi:MAG: hypothetical protein JWP89_4132 [Schlesneria sp.]|nr:hypothetical protein [Schlesneria sp.]